MSEMRAALDDVERITEAFHDAYERLAPHFSYRTRKESAVPWRDVPAPNKGLMRTTVASLIADGVIAVPKGAAGDEG